MGVCWHWLQREQEKSLNAAGPLLVVSDFVISYRTFYGMDDLGRERLNQDSRFLHSFPDFLALALESPESLEAVDPHASLSFTAVTPSPNLGSDARKSLRQAIAAGASVSQAGS